MPLSEVSTQIFRTLLYYDIFDHPLTARELYHLLPRNSLSEQSFIGILNDLAANGVIASRGDFFAIPSKASDTGRIRLERQKRARQRMKIARFMSHIMKRFPFVRAVFLSGDLSKGVANPDSDIDYVIVTEPGRLWICRTLLILFKKIFLVNRKKYFCLNFFLDANHLAMEERNYYTATEVAHLKPLFNQTLFLKFMNANNWIHEYFPNYRLFAFSIDDANSRSSFLQKLSELSFRGGWAGTLDRSLMNTMKRVWRKRYPHYDDSTRESIFHSTAYESRAFVGNFSNKILDLYAEKLRQHGMT
ncbi:MAG: nucleotidyltransferase domain-containing protein [Ignavibacteriae bacterium]|nr:nucleotidyltransferase domain-containing protein [Ignavibacteria bacterium]MBI3365553.1 nucleotidyltransferase domain-containing protein [Ignavibacteriota bacterium]